MQTTYKLIKTFSFLTVLCALHASLSASATRTAYVDPFATARGNAFTATANNPSAVFYNSAGLNQIKGTEVQANVYAVSAQYEFTNSNMLGRSETDDHFQPIPSFFAAHNFDNLPIALGFGMYAPFALGVDWGEDSAFYTFGVPHDAELAYVKYHLALAWQVTESLSIGIGPSYDNVDVTINSSPANPLGSFEGDDNTIGFAASILWQPTKEHSFGINYQHHTDVRFKGTLSNFAVPSVGVFTGSATADLAFPESIVAGYSWRPNEKWNIEFNLDWTNWDRVDELTVTNSFYTAAVPLNWESSFIWELGATRYFDNGMHLSAGYTFVENSVPDADFLPIVPDADRHFFQLGLGGKYERISWQLTYQYAYSGDRNVSVRSLDTFGQPNAAKPVLDGDYDLSSHAFACSLNYSF